MIYLEVIFEILSPKYWLTIRYWALKTARSWFISVQILLIRSLPLRRWRSIGQNQSKKHEIWIGLNKISHCEWLEIAPVCARCARLVARGFKSRKSAIIARKSAIIARKSAIIAKLTLCFALATDCTSALFGMAATSSLCCCCWFGCWFGSWSWFDSCTRIMTKREKWRIVKVTNRENDETGKWRNGKIDETGNLRFALQVTWFYTVFMALHRYTHLLQ